MLQFLDKYDGILPNLPRSYGRICCICGKDVTYSRDGTPVWYRYKDENGYNTGEWTCHNCNGKKKGYKFRVFRCRLCGSGETRIRANGKPIWIRDIDINQEFTGDYLCYKCYYQIEKKCHKCGKIKDITREHIDGMWTGKFICRDYHIEHKHNILYCSFCNKEIRYSYYEKLYTGEICCSQCIPRMSVNCRNKNIDPDSSIGIGYVTEVLVARFLNIDTCFDTTGKFNYASFDIHEDEDYGKINVKGSSFINNSWCFGIRKNIKCDFFFCICYDKDRRHISRVYVFPNEEFISNNTLLYIYADDYKYDFFREDEKPWDDLFHKLKLDDCPVLRDRQ